MGSAGRRGPDLYVTTDVGRGVALVRGDQTLRVVRMISTDRPRYSSSGRGWIIPIEKWPDVVAYAEAAHFLCIVSARKDESRTTQ